MLISTFALGILVGVAYAAIQAYRVKKKRTREAAAAAALGSPAVLDSPTTAESPTDREAE